MIWQLFWPIARACQHRPTTELCLCWTAQSWEIAVVQVILQETITNTKLKLFQEVLILHDIECIKYIKLFALSEDQSILHELMQRHRCGNIPIGVSSLQKSIFVVAQYC